MNVPRLTEEQLKTAFSPEDLQRAEGVVGQFYDCIVKNGDLNAKIKGNHGIYNVTLKTSQTPLQVECADKNTLTGSCKHLAALGLTYIYTPWVFKCEDNIDRAELSSVDDIQFYVSVTPLRQLVDELKAKGIPMSRLAEITRTTVHMISQVIRHSENGTPHILTDPLKFTCMYLLEKAGK